MKSKIATLQEKMKAGKTAFGTHTHWGGAALAELYGIAGFDALWIDTEHGAVDKSQLLNTIVGAATSDMAVFVRVAWNDMVLAKPILDMGVEGIIFPMVLTADDAARAVAACRYPPDGVRGFGPCRAVRYGDADTIDYIDNRSREVWPVIQIEHIDAVRNLDAILKVPGIGMFIVGPCDLSASLGLLGHTHHPEVKKAMDEAAAAIRASGIPFGVSMGYDDMAAREWIARGANIIFADSESGYLMRGCRHTLKQLRAARDGAPAEPASATAR